MDKLISYQQAWAVKMQFDVLFLTALPAPRYLLPTYLPNTASKSRMSNTFQVLLPQQLPVFGHACVVVQIARPDLRLGLAATPPFVGRSNSSNKAYWLMATSSNCVHD
ncbi:MAG: hypothetical protein U5L01_09620 [Rheinheimera sp.]|nr:hypothetical protein [Rheinheimera sp.]